MKKNIGFALTGSFCTLGKTFAIMEALKESYTLTPIVSERVAATDTRFFKKEEVLSRLERICGVPPLQTLPQVEPIGPKKLFDLLVICPCTGNTLSKMALGITDSCVTMAAKSHLRNGRPVIVAVSTNDGLAGAAENIGRLLARKHYYFVPFGQDDPKNKPTSLVADFEKIPETVELALKGIQIQSILI